MLIAEHAARERSPVIIQNSSNPSSRKTLDVQPYDRPFKVLLLASAANFTAGLVTEFCLYFCTMSTFFYLVSSRVHAYSGARSA